MALSLLQNNIDNPTVNRTTPLLLPDFPKKIFLPYTSSQPLLTLSKNLIRFMSYPQTEPPAPFVEKIVSVFRQHLDAIGTLELKKGLSSDAVLAILREDLLKLGFEAEAGKRAEEKIARPVFFGENGIPSLRYEIDAFHMEWRCGLEIEAGRAWMGNAVYRDLIQALVMVEVDTLVLAVPNNYRYLTKGRNVVSKDYDNTVSIANALYGHSRMKLPYRLVIIGY